MKKSLIKGLSLLAAIALLTTMFSSFVIAAAIGVDWYANQNQNPWPGSPFTFEKYESGSFSKLDTFVSGTGWTNSDSTVGIGTWFAKASNTRYAAIVYTTTAAGTAAITNTNNLALKNGFSGEFIIMQSNGTEFYPMYPQKGTWQWQTVNVGDSIPFATINTYLNAQDKIYFVLRAKNTGETSELQLNSKVDFAANGSDTGNLRPKSFGTFIKTFLTNPLTVSNSWYVNNITTNSRVDSTPFAYLKGTNGVYDTALTNRKDLSGGNWAWTNTAEASPWIGPWFVSSNTNIDGVVEFTSEADGVVSVSSSLALKIETKGTSDGFKVMIVQKDMNGQYYPLWPSQGAFNWQTIDDSSNITLPSINTGVKAGDRILYIVRSTGNSVNDTLFINPSITTTPGSTSSPRPSSFVAWAGEVIPPVIYTNSWYVNNVVTNSRIDNTPFAYLKGFDGKYDTLLANRKNFSGSNWAWTNTNEGSPWIGPWFVSAERGSDGIVEYTADKTGVVTITSDTTLKIEQKGLSDGFEMIVVQKNAADQYYPLWPQLGSWNWQFVDDASDISMGNINTGVIAGDRILYIVRSKGTSTTDTVSLSPKVTMQEASTTAARPSGFGLFENKAPVEMPKLIRPTTQSSYKISGGYLVGVTPGTLLSNIISNLSGEGTLKAFDNSGTEITDTNIPAITTMRIKLFTGASEIDSVEILIFGDSGLTGTIEIANLAIIKNHLLKNTILTGSQYKASNVNGIEGVSISDLLVMKKQNLGLSTISQTPAFSGVESTIIDSATLVQNQSNFYGVCNPAFESEVYNGVYYQKGIKTLKNLGANSMRLWMHTSNLLIDPYTYKGFELALLKDVVSEAQSNNIEVIGMNHNWFNGLNDNMSVPQRDMSPNSEYVKFLLNYEQTWYTIVKAFPQITYWEIGNEWNHDTFLHPEGYESNNTIVFTAEQKAQIATDMLYFGSNGIHRANANALTILGGITGIYWDAQVNIEGFYNKIYSNIAASKFSTNPDRYFQVAAWHPYISGATDQNWLDTNLSIYNNIVAKEGHSKIVVLSEFGYTDSGNAATDVQQATYLTSMLSTVKNNMPFVKSVYWYTLFNDSTAISWGGLTEANFGLMNEPEFGFTPKQKAYAFQSAAGGTGNLSEFAN
jgi:hypothetical protein